VYRVYVEIDLKGFARVNNLDIQTGGCQGFSVFLHEVKGSSIIHKLIQRKEGNFAIKPDPSSAHPAGG
jgi:hypothetical protein